MTHSERVEHDMHKHLRQIRNALAGAVWIGLTACAISVVALGLAIWAVFN